MTSMGLIPYDKDDLDVLDWLYEKFKLVVWADRPRDQVAANLFLFVLAAISSTVSLGLTLVLALIFGFFALVGMGRLAVAEARDNQNVITAFIVVVAASILAALAIGVQAVYILVGGLAVVPVLSTLDII